MGTAWYVLHTKPKRETAVYSYLKTQGIEVFYPSVKVKPVNPRASTIRPYFPRYLFVHADLDEVGISALQWVPNAIGLVQFDGIAAAVPDSLVITLKKRLEEIKAAGGLALDGLAPGDAVRITQGPLAGYDALFDMRLTGTERVQVLLEMLGRQVRVQVDAGAIEKKKTR